MISKLNHRGSRSPQSQLPQKNATDKEAVLILIGGDATRETVRSTLEKRGHPVIAEKCPTRALCQLTGDPRIRHVVICGQLTCAVSNEFMERAQRLRKSITPIMNGVGADHTTLIGSLV